MIERGTFVGRLFVYDTWFDFVDFVGRVMNDCFWIYDTPYRLQF